VAEVDQLAQGIYRISSYSAATVSFNQFLIEDERPLLIHTGQYSMYEQVRAAVANVLDPARLEYIVVPHFEGDECGGMGRFVAEAKDAVLACSALGAAINLRQWDYAGPILGARDGDVLELGEHRLRFLETPHVHHWDSMMVFDETTKSLFTSDLFLQPGDQPPIVREDLADEMCDWYRTAGLFAAEEPVRRVVDRIEGIAPDWIHPMHGGSLPAEVIPPYMNALREQAYAFDGSIFGRELPTGDR
jgi:flavorubredoxin